LVTTVLRTTNAPVYSRAPHNDVSFNDGPHRRRWSYKVTPLCFNCLLVQYSVQVCSLGAIGKGKGRAIPLQAWTDPEGSRRLRLPDFKTFGT